MAGDELDDSALRLEPIRVGRVPRHPPTPDLYVVAGDGERARLRVDVYGDAGAEAFCFTDAIRWRGWVVIGVGHQVHLVALDGQTTRRLPLGAYFGSLYPGETFLLVASATSLSCVAPEGELRRTSGMLGIDGVVIDEVRDGIVCGEGEWDPPGGWVPFQVSLESGRRVETASSAPG
ncbi:MAG TPA: hypothetical protein VD886_25485 [Herpetosiphonaceae bacterium]|nr:hypothetical protein [Herpetosiphonaceae bacterium]